MVCNQLIFKNQSLRGNVFAISFPRIAYMSQYHFYYSILVQWLIWKNYNVSPYFNRYIRYESRINVMLLQSKLMLLSPAYIILYSHSLLDCIEVGLCRLYNLFYSLEYSLLKEFPLNAPNSANFSTLLAKLKTFFFIISSHKLSDMKLHVTGMLLEKSRTRYLINEVIKCNSFSFLFLGYCMKVWFRDYRHCFEFWGNQ
jgi:hypothetical protein